MFAFQSIACIPEVASVTLGNRHKVMQTAPQHLEPEGCMEEALLAGTLLPKGAGQQLSPTTAPPSPSGSRSKSSSVYIPQLRPIIWMAWGIFAPVCHAD